MKTLLLGGTGLIGRAVTRRLLNSGADVDVLCRNQRSCDKTESLGAKPLIGDIASPESWTNALAGYDAVIHMACTFESDMPVIDNKLCSLLVEKLSVPGKKNSIIYTGGTWLYADSNGNPITENTPYSALPGFEWMVNGAQFIQSAKSVRGITIHPAVAVEDPDGIPLKLIGDYENNHEVSIPVGKNLAWPIVDTADLADAYLLILEKGVAGECYLAAGIESANVFRLAEILAKREGLNTDPVIKPIEHWIEANGETAIGYTLSQNLDSTKLRRLGWQPSLNSLR